MENCKMCEKSLNIAHAEEMMHDVCREKLLERHQNYLCATCGTDITGIENIWFCYNCNWNSQYNGIECPQ